MCESNFNKNTSKRIINLPNSLLILYLSMSLDQCNTKPSKPAIEVVEFNVSHMTQHIENFSKLESFSNNDNINKNHTLSLTRNPYKIGNT